MTHTPEQAREQANATLAILYANVSSWDESVLDQALLAIAGEDRPFSANDLWEIVPPMGRGVIGLYFNNLSKRRQPHVLQHVGYEPSVNPKAHGKPVNTYLLTADGRRFLEDRRTARTQGRAA